MKSNKIMIAFLMFVGFFVTLLNAAPSSQLLQDPYADTNPEDREIIVQKRVKKSLTPSELQVPIIESDTKSTLMEQKNVPDKENGKPEVPKITVDSDNLKLDIPAVASVEKEKESKEEILTDNTKVEPVNTSPEVPETSESDVSLTSTTEMPVKTKSNNKKLDTSKISVKKADFDNFKSALLKIDVIKKLNETEFGKEDEEFLKKGLKKLSESAKVELEKDGGSMITDLKKSGDSFFSDIKKSDAVKKFLAKINSFSESNKTSEKNSNKRVTGQQSKSKNIGAMNETSVENNLNKEGGDKKEDGVLDGLKEAGESVLEDMKKAGESALEELKKKGKSRLEDVKKVGNDFLDGLKKRFKINRK